MMGFGELADRYRVTTDPLRTQRRIELAVLLLALILCLQLAYGAVRLLTMKAPAPVEPAADSVTIPPARTPQAVEPGQREAIVSRPLFWTSRRPGEAGSVAVEDAETAGSGLLKGVKLVGVFGGGESAGIIALVQGKKRRILLGEDMEGWTLKSVGPSDGLFTRGAQRETLMLEHAAVNWTESSAAGTPKPGEVGAGNPQAGGAADPGDARKIEAAPPLSLGGSGK